MPLKVFKPTSPGRRFMTGYSFDEITGKKPLKKLTRSKKRSGGRNNRGRITAPRRGGGHKKRYRFIDFKRDKHGVPARVASVEYDPNRSARIALLHYRDGEKRYIVAPEGLKVGDEVVSSRQADIKPGNSLPLADIPLGTMIHWPRKASTRTSGFPPARSAWSTPSAGRSSARFRIPITRICTSARRAGIAGSASGLASGALP
jgi:large subunit ribosomal protein L2